MPFSRELAQRDGFAERWRWQGPGPAGSALATASGAKRGHTAELIIVFKMFQEPQKQIK